MAIAIFNLYTSSSTSLYLSHSSLSNQLSQCFHKIFHLISCHLFAISWVFLTNHVHFLLVWSPSFFETLILLLLRPWFWQIPIPNPFLSTLLILPPICTKWHLIDPYKSLPLPVRMSIYLLIRWNRQPSCLEHNFPTSTFTSHYWLVIVSIIFLFILGFLQYSLCYDLPTCCIWSHRQCYNLKV